MCKVVCVNKKENVESFPPFVLKYGAAREINVNFCCVLRGISNTIITERNFLFVHVVMF